MSLRVRLFLIFGGLTAILILAQAAMYRSLVKNLSLELDEVALSLSSDVIQVITLKADIFVKSESQTMTSPRIVYKKTIKEKNVPQPDTPHTSVEKPPAKLEILKKFVQTTSEPKGTQSKDKQTVRLEYSSNDSENQKNRSISSRSHDADIHTVWTDELDILTETMVVELDDPKDAKFVLIKTPNASEKIPIPKQGISGAVDNIMKKLIIGSTVIFLIGLLLISLLAHRVSAPLRQLAYSAHLVGKGELGISIPNSKIKGEVGQAILAFNTMSSQLKSLDEESKKLRNQNYLAELGEIARGMAHTIRNPLNAIGLSVEQMAALQENNKKSLDIAQTARRQIRRIDQWIRSFLALASKGQESEESFDLTALVQDVVLEAIQDNPGKIDISLDVGETSHMFTGVLPELRAVVQALVVNAVEASPQNGKIDVFFKVDPLHQITIEVIDEGEGLPEKVRDRLFSPHVTTKSQGSGMGLFLAHRITTSKYGGSLTISDRNNGPGTRAVLALPGNGRVCHGKD